MSIINQVEFFRCSVSLDADDNLDLAVQFDGASLTDASVPESDIEAYLIACTRASKILRTLFGAVDNLDIEEEFPLEGAVFGGNQKGN